MKFFETDRKDQENQQSYPSNYARNTGIQQTQTMLQRNLLDSESDIDYRTTIAGKKMLICINLLSIVLYIYLAVFIIRDNYWNWASNQYTSNYNDDKAPYLIFAYLNDPCRTNLFAILYTPLYCVSLAAFNLFATCFACVNVGFCFVFQLLFAAIFAVSGGIFFSLKTCETFKYDQITILPLNAGWYYLWLSAICLLNGLANLRFAKNKTKQRQNQRNLSVLVTTLDC